MNDRHLYIVTGSSRGLGQALAAEWLSRTGTTLLGMARHSSPALDALAERCGSTCEQWTADLAEPPGAAARLEDWLVAVDAGVFASATLVNNAAVITDPAPLDAVDPEALSRALRVGLEAPALLCAAFLRGTAAWPGTRRILNISSGLGRRAMAGAAAYCAVKAGLDHLTRALALEHAAGERGAAGKVRVASLAPGVIDTDMQVQLRSADATAFPDRQRFVELHTNGQLASGAATAAKIAAWIERADFGHEPIADIRET